MHTDDTLPGLVQPYHIQIQMYMKVFNLYKKMETSENQTVCFNRVC